MITRFSIIASSITKSQNHQITRCFYQIIKLVFSLMLVTNVGAESPGRILTESEILSEWRQEIIPAAVTLLVSGQEKNGAWPYEGVYRVNDKIPMGYQVAGTAICARALFEAPGYRDNPARPAAVHQGMNFMFKQIADPSMDPAHLGGYDVRGWGWIYLLQCCLRYQELGLADPTEAKKIEEVIPACVAALNTMEVKANRARHIKRGGWTYAAEYTGSAISFMTAPALQGLFKAKARGYAVDEPLIQRALEVMEKGREDDGAFQYTLWGVGTPKREKRDVLPGAVARSAMSEATLRLAHRSTPERLEAALEAFFKYWGELHARYQKEGTHAGPYEIAPYYVMFAHWGAAQAIELLPEAKRPEYRVLLMERLQSLWNPKNWWNDRVFPRSRNVGTAMALMALLAPQLPSPTD